MKTEKLIPTNGQKSFGGKAVVISFDDGWTYLKSYHTIVAAIGARGGMIRLTDVRTSTTSRHVQSFFRRYAGCNIDAKDFYSWTLCGNVIHPEIEEEQ